MNVVAWKKKWKVMAKWEYHEQNDAVENLSDSESGTKDCPKKGACGSLTVYLGHKHVIDNLGIRKEVADMTEEHENINENWATRLVVKNELVELNWQEVNQEVACLT